jgi:hypothetical protein
MRVRSTRTQAIRIIFLLGIVTLTQTACGGSPAAPRCGSAANCTRVLFIGDSYTYVNDLPATFAFLSSSGGHPVETGTDAQGGATLTDHAAAASTTAVDQGYLTIADEQGAPVAPVGYAWQTMLAQTAPSDLWQSDGIHPTSKGTYLAACVFYATIFRASPKGLTYHSDLSDADAATVQGIASDIVLGDPPKWGLR